MSLCTDQIRQTDVHLNFLSIFLMTLAIFLVLVLFFSRVCSALLKKIQHVQFMEI